MRNFLSPSSMRVLTVPSGVWVRSAISRWLIPLIKPRRITCCCCWGRRLRCRPNKRPRSAHSHSVAALPPRPSWIERTLIPHTLTHVGIHLPSPQVIYRSTLCERGDPADDRSLFCTVLIGMLPDLHHAFLYHIIRRGVVPNHAQRYASQEQAILVTQKVQSMRNASLYVQHERLVTWR